MHEVSAVILAAGLGSRLQQTVPKPLISLMGIPLFARIVRTLEALGIQDIVAVIRPDAQEAFDVHVPDFSGRYCYQEHARGTAEAALLGIRIARHEKVLVLHGDVPCVPGDALQELLKRERGVLVFQPVAQQGYGIVACDQGDAVAIHEEHHDVGLANAGVYVVPRHWALAALQEIRPKGCKGEQWLTEMVAMAYQQAVPFQVVCHGPAWCYEGINTVAQWLYLEEKLQKNQACTLLQQGVYLDHPESIQLVEDMQLAPGVYIGRGCVFAGSITIAEGTVIQAYCVLKNVDIAAHVTIHSFTTIMDSRIDAQCSIGPYAHVHASHCHKHAVVGNYVEVVRSTLGAHTKAKHLAYLGDTTSESHVNIGAGTITCNYDGKKKHATYIAQGCFIGAHSTLIAPLRVGAYAVVAAGSVLATDAPSGMLSIGRVPCITMQHPLCEMLARKADPERGA